MSEEVRSAVIDLIKETAHKSTGTDGVDALNRLAKKMVINEMGLKGFHDSRNEKDEEIFNRPYVCAGYFNLLVRFSFLGFYDKFTWDFASGNVVGRPINDSYISSTGRHSKWVGNGAEKNWAENNINGVVLVGVAYSSPFWRYYYLSKEEFFSLGKDKLICRPEQIASWSDSWISLQHEKTFSSELGANV